MRITATRALSLTLALPALLLAPARAVSQDTGATTASPAPSASAESEALTSLYEEAEALRSGIEQLMAALGPLEASIAAASGEDRLLLERQLDDRWLALLDDVHRLGRDLRRLEALGSEVSGLRRFLDRSLAATSALIRRLAEDTSARLAELRNAREQQAPDQLLALEQEVDRESRRLDQLHAAAERQVLALEEFGVTARNDRAWLTSRLRERADSLLERVLLARARLDGLRRQARGATGTEGQTLLRAAEQRLASLTSSLEATIGSMRALRFEDVSAYEARLIESTGRVTRNVIDPKVAVSLAGSWAQRARGWFADRGPGLFFQVFVVVLILLVFRGLTAVTRRLVRRALSAEKLRASQLLREGVEKISGRAVMILGVLVALSQVGVSLTPLLAGLGIAGFIVGFALQDTLSNFAAGLMILFYRPYDVGDSVEAAGVAGTVNKMSLVSTTILTFDNQTLVVPNSKIWGGVIRNVTAQARRRVDMGFGISYDDDVEKAERILTEIVQAHPKVLADPAPVIKLHKLGESSVDFVVRPWSASADYWNVYWDITREVKLRFDREGITIPYPQRDVHVHHPGAKGEASSATTAPVEGSGSGGF